MGNSTDPRVPCLTWWWQRRGLTMRVQEAQDTNPSLFTLSLSLCKMEKSIVVLLRLLNGIWAVASWRLSYCFFQISSELDVNFSRCHLQFRLLINGAYCNQYVATSTSSRDAHQLSICSNLPIDTLPSKLYISSVCTKDFSLVLHFVPLLRVWTMRP